jgi:hypothetical protein
MGVGGALQRLGRFVEDCERSATVDGVELAGGVDREAAGAVSTTVELALSHRTPGEATELCATTVNADGTVRFGFETTEAVVPSVDGVDAEPTGAVVGPDGSVGLTLSVSATAGSPRENREDLENPENPETGPSTADGGRDLPPFKDPQLLGEVYESCDTFAEMAERLEMDVTAETVRRYMIDFGIHEPNSYDTSGADDGSEAGDAAADDAEATPPVLSDGIGLPEDITVETLIETVERSNTIYEVKRDLGVGREDALGVLRECNLLDLVMCRLATEAERDITRADVIDRLRAASETG